MKYKKKRCDNLLVLGGFVEDLDTARRLIMAGKVRNTSDSVVSKASEKFLEDTEFIVDDKHSFVSRSAAKLKGALDKYVDDLSNMVCLDIGASTGGFTEVMLRKNAAKVYAVDVGTGLLHYKLRTDERVVVLEGINARHLSEKEIPEKGDILSCDVSFISLKTILPAVNPFLKKGAWAFTLIKPQFEAEKKDVPHGGIIIDKKLQQKIVNEINLFAKDRLNWTLIETVTSPVKGTKGNQEFVSVFRK
ncbi:MAG: TlyA family RNA methyltransferase [Verrucomicrobiota bacterium]|nr:TlyA family RNA methyltransferase [Verrucomicrobiota bacterium]